MRSERKGDFKSEWMKKKARMNEWVVNKKDELMVVKERMNE